MKEMPQPPRNYLTQEQVNFIINDIDNHQVPLDTVKFDSNLFKGYKNIIIVGPPRSGTTFTGRAIAHTLSYKYIDENTFNNRDVRIFNNLIKNGNNVIQAPGFTHIAHLIANPHILIVFLVRKWSDITKSLVRTNGKISDWQYTSTLYEYELYNRMNPGIRTHCTPFHDPNVKQYFDKYIDKKGYAIDMHYKMWKYYQRNQIPNWIQLDYESMNSHPMWVEKNERKNTSRKEISLPPGWNK
jgi:hypothetical protein